jgi:ornithine decarboxylase
MERSADIARRLTPHRPLYCFFPEHLRENVEAFRTGFDGKVLYAVKSSPLEMMLDELWRCGIRDFDVASAEELALVRGRFADADCYLMNPAKSRAAIEQAILSGVRHFAVDHLSEVQKIADVAADGRDLLTLFVRLHVDGGHSTFDLSSKFGASTEDAARILRAQTDLGFSNGVCFHVGSQCLDPAAYRKGVETAERLASATDVMISALDIGGGFPGHYDGAGVPPLPVFLENVSDALRRAFDVRDCLRLCEPGRSLVWNALTLVAQVHLRKNDALYLNDGIYGSLLGAKLGLKYRAVAVLRRRQKVGSAVPFSLFGPTCDSLDKLQHTYMLPDNIDEGDWVVFDGLGAYSTGLRTGFNGFFPRSFTTAEAAAASVSVDRSHDVIEVS